MLRSTRSSGRIAGSRSSTTPTRAASERLRASSRSRPRTSNSSAADRADQEDNPVPPVRGRRGRRTRRAGRRDPAGIWDAPRRTRTPPDDGGSTGRSGSRPPSSGEPGRPEADAARPAQGDPRLNQLRRGRRPAVRPRLGRQQLVRHDIGNLLDAEPARVRRPTQARTGVPGTGALRRRGSGPVRP